MPEKVVPGPVCEDRSIREAVCIHTRKIFDSCKDKDIALLILFGKGKEGRSNGAEGEGEPEVSGLCFLLLAVPDGL